MSKLLTLYKKFTGNLSQAKKQEPNLIEHDSWRNPINQAVPKILWLLWLEGFEKAPPFVRLCYERWQKLNPEWEVRFLDKNTASEAINLDLDLYYEKISQMIPDHHPKVKTSRNHFTLEIMSLLVRSNLLKKHGGIWSDATTWCVRPLDDWINMMTANSGFFAFLLVDEHQLVNEHQKIVMFFLAAVKGNAFVDVFQKKVQEFIEQSDEKMSENRWFRPLLSSTLSHQNVQGIWNAMPKINSSLMGEARLRAFDPDFQKQMRYIMQNQQLPIVRFSARNKIPENFANTPFAILLDRDTLS